MPSVYVLHRKDQLPTTSPDEGRIYPLLRKVDDDHVTWAFAVPQAAKSGSTKEQRKNRLICAVLQSLGFVLDVNNAASGKQFDFYHMADENSIYSFSYTGDEKVFDDTFPDLNGGTGDLRLLSPTNGADALKLAKNAAKAFTAGATVKVDHFVFAAEPGSFRLGLSGQETSPEFTANITLNSDLKSVFSTGILPVLSFKQSGIAGFIQCNDVNVIASNQSPDGNTTIAADIRHDRLSLDGATLVCTEPDTSRKLAIEVFPAISFQPNKDLPVTVSISNDGVSLRLQPLEDNLDPRLTINRFKPCVRVTVRGPVIHADSSAGGALEALRLLEPAERKLNDTVEQINDFLVYSFEVCLPDSDVKNLQEEDLTRLDLVSLPLKGWPNVDMVDGAEFKTFFGNLSDFFSKLMGLSEPLFVKFPDVGLPSLTEYDFTRFDLHTSENKITVEFPDEKLKDVLKELTTAGLWSVKLLRPHKPELELAVSNLNVDGLEVEFEFSNADLSKLEIDASSRLRVKWNIEIQGTSTDTNKLTLNTLLPTVRLPKIDGAWDFRLLKVRARKDKRDVGTFSITEIKDYEIVLDLPKIDGKYPDMELFNGATVEFALDLTLPLTKCFLSDLLGDLGSVDFRLSAPQPTAIDFAKISNAFGSLATPIIPLELVVRVPHPTKPKLEWDELNLVLGMKFDLATLRLAENRIYFFLPKRRSSDSQSNFAPRQVMDFDIFTLTFPNRPEPLGIPTEDNHDGYLDLTSREFVIDLKYKNGEEPTPPPRIHAFFPGGMDARAARLGREGVENLGKKDTDYSKFLKEYSKRFDLELDEVDPKLWPNSGPDRLMFRFNSNGLTFAANLGKTEVIVDDSGAEDSGAEGSKPSNGLIKPFKFQPQDKQRELRSRIVIIDNELKEAGVYAKTEVPGVENLIAEVSVTLRQRRKGMLPEVRASMELERADGAPLAEFSIKLLELSLDRLELGLVWRMHEKEWDYSVIADGTIGFTGAAALVPDLEDLRVPSIQVVGLDLRRMNLRQLRIPINLVRPVRFDILDGMFGVELGNLEIAWEFDDNIPKPRLLACEFAKLTFKNPGALEVSVSVGGLHIEFDEKLKARVKLPSSLGIEVALGTSARFAGRVGWIDNKDTGERYLFASGKLMLEGFPEVSGILKFGTGVKNGGRPEINLVLYGAMELDEQLFSGAVVKSLGLGVGLNNRLAALPPTPSADAILRRIDLVKPGEIEGWQFVREGGFYMSIIGTVTLASNLGDPNASNAYVAALAVSIDSNFDLVAAGKLWLSCSVKGQKDNPNNPAFVGAMVLSPRQRKLEVVLESRKNAYVEKNDHIKKLLDKGFVRFAFRMTPQLVDYHLAELSYRDQMFGVQMEYRGEYRFAIFKRAVLLKNELSATGSISKSLNGGTGGFDLDGKASLRLGYGGLLSEHGAMAYAFINAGIRFRVSAWIEIGFSISFCVCGKRCSRSWTIVFRTRVPQLELTLRGHVAIADRGGLGGFELLVGINVPICGYRLNVAAGWAANVDLYQEVRSTVAAFEAELEAAVRALDSERAKRSSSNKELIISYPTQVQTVSEDRIPSVDIGLNPNSQLSENAPLSDAKKANPAPEIPPESWLFYSRNLGVKSTALLVPAPDGLWLTPTMATINKITVKDTTVTFNIEPPISSLPNSTKIRLIGLRAKETGQQGTVAKLNGTWAAEITTNGTQTARLKVAERFADEKVIELFGGVWRIDESDTVPGLSPEDHDTVPYLNEVERAIVRTGGWKEVTNVTKVNDVYKLTVRDHGITANASVRVVFRCKNQPIVDGGIKRISSDKDHLSVTFVAKSVSVDELELDKLGGIIPETDWQLATAIEIAPTWSARNRLAALRDKTWKADEYRDYTGAAAVWAETAAKAGSDSEVLQSSAAYAVVFDERYNSADPRFAPVDAPVEPGVLSTRFKPIDDVNIVGVDGILESARRYEEAIRSVAQQQLHGAFNLDEKESIQQSRAQAMQLLVHRLSDPSGPKKDDRLEAPVAVHQSAKVAYGWFCEADNLLWDFVASEIKEGSNDVLFVRRAGGEATAVTVKLPDSHGVSAKKKLVPLPIRQDFVIDEASEVSERGRVIVPLPIRYMDDVLRRSPQDVGKLQVYRRIGDGPEELVYDQLRLDVNQLERKQVYSKSRQQFVDEVQQRKGDEDYLLIGSFDKDQRLLSISNPLATLLPRKPADSAIDPLISLKCRVGEKHFTITAANRKDGIQLTLSGNELPDSGPLTFSLVADGIIVPRPVLISDQFTVTDRQFDSPELRAAVGSGRSPIVRYSLVALSEDDPGGIKPVSAEYERLPFPAPVPLFIPKRKEALPNLALAIPIESLFQKNGNGFVFQLVDMSGDSPKLAERNGRPLSAEEFEFYLDGEILRQSGFYAGEAADPNPPRERDGERITLAAVNSTDGYESTVGKIWVKTTSVNGTRYEFTDTTFQAGSAFRAFFRSKGETSTRSLRRLPILLVREFPRTWDATVRYRLIDTVEIIPQKHKELVQNAEAIPHLAGFSADDRYDAGRAAIRTVWPALTLLDGGVELQFRDFHDSSMRSRTMVEMLESDEFRKSQTDFRDDTYWTPRPFDLVERYATRVVASAKTPDAATFKSFYLWNRFGAEIDVIARLEDAKKLLCNTANVKSEGCVPKESTSQESKWSMFATAVKTAQTALLSFEKSPLNLNTLTLRQKIELLRLKLRAVVVGNKVADTEDLPAAQAANQSLLELLTKIEQSRVETVSDTDANDVAFLDRNTARKLAGIVRRRIAIANEVMTLRDLEEIPKTDSMLKSGNNGSFFVGQPEWDRIYGDAKSLAGTKPLPMTESLAVKMTHTDGPATTCIKQIDSLIVEIGKLKEERLYTLVPRAAGLSELLHRLNDVIRGTDFDTPAGLLKRPHHELTTTRKEDGEIVAREVPLRDFLPARARQAKLGTTPEPPDERLERLGIRAGHLATLSKDGNVAIWTTRGQSVHDVPMERVQYFSAGVTTDSTVVAFELSEAPDGPRLLIARKVNGKVAVELWDVGEAKEYRSYEDNNEIKGANFAATSRGLEVALVKGSNVELHTTEPSKSVDLRRPEPRAGLLFKDGGSGKEFDGPVAYHDEIQVVAAARGNMILFWRDMGRPENDTPFLYFKLVEGSAATHIKPITLPSGAGFVIASSDPGKGLFFVDPLSRKVDNQRQLIPTVIDKSAISVTHLAVDRRELKASAVIKDKDLVHTYDLLQLTLCKAQPVAKSVAILHGRHREQDESYLAYTKYGNVLVSSFKDDPAATDVELRQTLIGPTVLGKNSEASEIVAVTTALQTARRAVAAGDPLSLFHLWERMGFSLDIAAQDKTNRLLPMNELREKIDAAIGQMNSEYRENHHIYIVEGEEPDAEFRNDRVGFSHINVAVVPTEFLASCLAPKLQDSNEKFEPLIEWLNNRSIRLAHNVETVKIVAGDSSELKQQKTEARRELEYIVHMTQLVGVPEPSRFGTVKGSTGTPAVLNVGELHLQPRSDRFVRVPASAETHWSWTLPDRKGHHMLVAARRVSRYEPLLRWWLNSHRRFDLPEEISLGRSLSIKEVDGNTVKVDKALPLETGQQPLRLEIVSGPGAGQSRILLPFEPNADRNELKIDASDPWLEQPTTASKCRVIDAAPGWRKVEIDPIHDPALGEGPRPLMVYQYPHSRKPRFSYQIPLDGMRATYNQISRVRTGYHGIEAAFRYFLPDQIDNPQAATLLDLLNAIKSSTEDSSVPSMTVTNVAGGVEPNVRLFRHERMVSLPGLPFYYKYRLDIRSAYKARTLEYDRTTAADLLPDDENASPPAQRLPACLGLNQMTLKPMVLTGKLPANQPLEKTRVRLFASGKLEGAFLLCVRPKSGADWVEKSVTDWQDGILTVGEEFTEQPREGWEYQVHGIFESVLYLSANRDHLTREEAISEPNPIKVNVCGEVEVCAKDLPDFFMEYHLFRNQIEGTGSLASFGDVFSVIGSIQMPWSPNFRATTNAKTKPRISVASGVKLVNFDDDGVPTLVGQEGSFAIEQVTIKGSGSPYWLLRFWMANDPGQKILEPGRVYLQAIRDGKLTRAVKCAPPK